jgi:hypothetical protein
MPQDTHGDPSGDAPPAGAGADLPANGGRLDPTPTLTELLKALHSGADHGADDSAGDDTSAARIPWMAALRALRDGAAPVDLADALRAEILRAVRNELGASASEAATLSLQGRPLTERTVERVLQAAARAAAARAAALKSAGLAPGVSESGLSLRKAVVEAAPPRDLRLLQYCLELIRSYRPELRDAPVFWRAAERLHDRVRALLERRGHWPIADERAYEEHAKPAALVLVSWKDPQG